MVRPTATKPHFMRRPRLLPKTSTWKQLRSLEFGIAAAPCADVVTGRLLCDSRPGSGYACRRDLRPLAADNRASSSPSPRGECNGPEGLPPRARPSTLWRARSISWSSATMACPRSQRAPREQGQPSVDSAQENWVRSASFRLPNALASGHLAQWHFTHSGYPTKIQL